MTPPRRTMTEVQGWRQLNPISHAPATPHERQENPRIPAGISCGALHAIREGARRPERHADPPQSREAPNENPFREAEKYLTLMESSSPGDHAAGSHGT
jgi:hypothetical protein